MFYFCIHFTITLYLVSDLWNKIIFNPIPKSNLSDNRDQLCYRRISLAHVAYKLYCKLINGRLSQWINDNNGLVDKQNGFYKGRSTVDTNKNKKTNYLNLHFVGFYYTIYRTL